MTNYNSIVILSLKPEWWKKIKSGEKTLEIRKSFPHAGMPILVYVYVCGTGAVQGSFVCDTFYHETPEKIYDRGGSCVSKEALQKYGNGKPLYAWGIRDVETFAVAAPIRHFGINRPPQSWQYYKK